MIVAKLRPEYTRSSTAGQTIGSDSPLATSGLLDHSPPPTVQYMVSPHRTRRNNKPLNNISQFYKKITTAECSELTTRDRNFRTKKTAFHDLSITSHCCHVMTTTMIHVCLCYYRKQYNLLLAER